MHGLLYSQVCNTLIDKHYLCICSFCAAEIEAKNLPCKLDGWEETKTKIPENIYMLNLEPSLNETVLKDLVLSTGSLQEGCVCKDYCFVF